MRVLVVVGCFIAAAIRYADAQAKADGGFRGGAPRPCDTNWSYRDGSGQTPPTSGCLSIVDFPPYKASEAPNQPSDPRTDTTQWCSFKQNKLRTQDPTSTVNAIYDVTKIDENKLTSWGYCLLEGGSNGTNSSGPSSAPTGNIPTEGFWADGGFAPQLTQCDDGWTYRDNGEAVQEGIIGCLDGNQFPPFQWNSGEPADPTLSGTDTTKWCSIKGGNKIYDTNPGVDEGDVKKKAWGYCFDAANQVVETNAPTAQTTSAPETGSPTASESNTTGSPVPGPQTRQPTASTTTTPPNTQAPTSTQPNAASPSSLSSGEIAAAVIVPFLVVIAAGGGFAYYK